jgi:branched-chain amino acid transport system substrate-binding protein
MRGPTTSYRNYAHNRDNGETSVSNARRPNPIYTPTRRDVLAGTAATAGLLLAPGRGWSAEAEDVVRVGYISPRTGNLGFFGEGDEYLLDLTRKALAGGLKIGGKSYKIEIIDRDAQSDPARAGQLAKSLISESKIDFMLVASTPEVVNPVADTCEAAAVPCLSTVMPWEAWYFGRGGKPGQSPFKWSFHFSFGGAQFAKMYISQWNKVSTNKRVGVMYPNDADGNAVRGVLPAALEKAGFTVIDPGPFEDFTTDFSTQIAIFKKEKCEICNLVVLPPDFATFWRQAAQHGYTKMVKIGQPAKAGANFSEIEALGQLGYKLSGGAPWNPAFPYKTFNGVSAGELASQYEAASHRQASQELGATMAVFDAAVAALQASGNPNDKNALVNTIRTLKTQTSVGLVDFTAGPMPGVVATTPLLGVQWVKTPPGSPFKARQIVTENANDPDVKIAAELAPYNS